MANATDLREATIKDRISLVRAMDAYVCNTIGDENIWMTWISIGVPDGASEEDYRWFAENDDEWAELCKLFSRCVEREVK